MALRDDLRAALEGGLRKIVLWTDQHGAATVEFGVQPFDPFFNLNTPQDMLLAEDIIWAQVCIEIFGNVGWKKCVNTGLILRLVAEFAGRGLTVSTVKHAHHSFDVDQPGKDSHRHRTAGASEVLLASGNRWALMHELRGAAEPPLEALLARLSPVDLVLIEGYKRDTHPKIEAHRSATGQPLIAPGDPTVLAVASDVGLPGLDRPVLDLDATGLIADFILASTGLRPVARTA